MCSLPVGTACFLMTRKERMMPGTVAGILRGGLVSVASPGGAVYTCNPENVYDVETGRIILMHARAEKMALDGYQIAVRFDRTFRVFQPKKHGLTGGWIVKSTGDTLTCNCPSHAKSLTCKHLMAVCSLLSVRAVRLRAAGKIRVATRYENVARAIMLAA